MEDSPKDTILETSVTGFRASPQRMWRLHWPWLFIPVACVVCLIFGVVSCLALSALSPFDRSITLGFVVVVAPLVGGAVLNYLLGAKRQWRDLGWCFLLTLASAAAAWFLNSLLHSV